VPPYEWIQDHEISYRRRDSARELLDKIDNIEDIMFILYVTDEVPEASSIEISMKYLETEKTKDHLVQHHKLSMRYVESEYA